MVQVLREASIEVGGEHDKAILQKDAGVRRWTPIPVEDEVTEATRPGALSEVNRKLSVTSTRSTASASARDGMTMGQKMEAQMNNHRAVEAQLEQPI